jgi:hypothetical protein
MPDDQASGLIGHREILPRRGTGMVPNETVSHAAAHPGRPYPLPDMYINAC